ncbi:DUF4352 domain-containing protein [Actinoplanes solisilvae]|uniref:DUF4352 domain-containing protein n=1 Tax=Actinoplanes solisilvae TaxID=2486853 RepID=UPI000FD82D69|nr:DUF4352 domain-containing protein [Actinoplanes solisilvae]
MTNTPLRPARSAPPAPKPPGGSSGRTKKSWLLTAVFALAAAGVGVYLAAGISGETAAPPKAVTAGATPEGAAPESAAPVVAASEGTIAITVTKTECGLSEVGPTDLPLAAEGEFCLVTMGIRNTGKAPRLLDPGAQRGIDGQGRSHRVAEQAAVLVNDQDPSLLDEIPPGATRQGVIPFDVPKGARLTAFVLHKSPDSTGVRVPLSG